MVTFCYESRTLKAFWSIIFMVRFPNGYYTRTFITHYSCYLHPNIVCITVQEIYILIYFNLIYYIFNLIYSSTLSPRSFSPKIDNFSYLDGYRHTFLINSWFLEVLRIRVYDIHNYVLYVALLQINKCTYHLTCAYQPRHKYL